MIQLFIVSIIWSASFIFIKGGLTGLNPFYLSFLRLGISLLIFLPFLNLKINIKDKLALILIGIIQFGMMYISYISAYSYLKSYEIALLTLMTPLYVILLDQFIEKKLDLYHVLIIGVNVLTTAYLSFKQYHNFNFGILLMQISNLAFAYGQIKYRHLRKRLHESDRSLMPWCYLGAVTFTGIAYLWFPSTGTIELSGNQWNILLYLGVVASGLGFFLWNWGASQVKGSVLALFNNLKVPLAVIFSAVFLGETIPWEKVFLVMGVFGLSLSFLTKKKAPQRFSEELEA